MLVKVFNEDGIMVLLKATAVHYDRMKKEMIVDCANQSRFVIDEIDEESYNYAINKLYNGKVDMTYLVSDIVFTGHWV